ncbi:TetR/AcrR family transcriptional regulator [Halioxenophilus sp. WMMB6]|uniref:TetR/AcrR family transcriptional regulator n=1 Tax=Halioxenophilus sp. WMMB6 TaxID=3073815 RepID=UPI00295F30F5|nr:TetR/AcrR family transcriptional regulator [Halioxenophilus sp. WMMB6]
MNRPKKKTPSNRQDGKRPGRQRSQEADESILAATLEVLANEGYGGFAVNKVIAKAGVSSATLYRRWATADELILAAFRSVGSEVVDIDSGSLEADIAAMINFLADSLSSLVHVAAAEASGPRAPKGLRDEVALVFAKPRMVLLQTILERAVTRGEIESVPPLSICWTMLVSPIHHQLYLSGANFTPLFASSLTTVLTVGFKALAMKV